MKHNILFLLFAIILMQGCNDGHPPSVASENGKLPNASVPPPSDTNEQKLEESKGPVILGFKSELMDEMRQLVFNSDPTANVEQVIRDFVDELRLAAKAAEIAPTGNGDYVLPSNVLQAMGKPRAEFDVIDDLAEELGLNLPSWTHPLIAEYNDDSITLPRKQLLFIVVFAKALPSMGQIAR